MSTKTKTSGTSHSQAVIAKYCICCLVTMILFRKGNRRLETRVDGSEGEEDKIGLLTSALMQEEAMDSL